MGKAASSRAPRSWAVGWALLRHSAKCPVNSRASAPKEATWRAPVQERPRTHHAATLGLGDGPRAVTTRTSPREPARRATTPRLRDRSGGPPAARAKHALSTRNTQQHGGQRRDASFGVRRWGQLCPVSAASATPTLTIQFWGRSFWCRLTGRKGVEQMSLPKHTHAHTDTHTGPGPGRGTDKNTTFYLNYLNQY